MDKMLSEHAAKLESHRVLDDRPVEITCFNGSIVFGLVRQYIEVYSKPERDLTLGIYTGRRASRS